MRQQLVPVKWTSSSNCFGHKQIKDQGGVREPPSMQIPLLVMVTRPRVALDDITMHCWRCRHSGESLHGGGIGGAQTSLFMTVAVGGWRLAVGGLAAVDL